MYFWCRWKSGQNSILINENNSEKKEIDISRALITSSIRKISVFKEKSQQHQEDLFSINRKRFVRANKTWFQTVKSRHNILHFKFVWILLEPKWNAWFLVTWKILKRFPIIWRCWSGFAWFIIFENQFEKNGQKVYVKKVR